MDIKPHKRHSKWYERLFFSTTTQIIITTFICAIMPAWILWGERFFSHPAVTEINSFYGVIASNICSLITLRVLLKFPGNKSSSFIISTVLAWYTVLIVVFLLFRLEYSLYFLVFSLTLTLFYGFLGFFFGRRWATPKIALIPYGRAADLASIPGASWYLLRNPEIEGERRYNMIVADLHSKKLTAEWQKFLAHCVLSGMPVYNSRQIEESLTGRVKIRHLHENQLGSLLPSPIYSVIKRITDIVVVLMVMPIVLPIMLITAIAVVLESKGGALFIQNRVGKGGKEFKIYKFRSMTKDSEKDGAQFASANDMRVTRIGKFIRKTRIDELPQFFNVLKGDMSLIGPRPEQKVFVDAFEEQIPFYNYRHIVRPGISGWAQVTQGYAADVEDTQIKVEHDFYYIKNFSLWLDLLIVFKTIKTMLTGFGSR
ncbi:glycosyl transferase [Oligella urethralis]|uniref:sugar transferase n=1 Tax=Oligella urethralis TaxID=90245 RepID=UPI000CFFA08F|nr:sugar transferase [Oligella urethralis]AVL71134.1 glycosyl transferase [Oligella urethralis]